MGCTSSAQSNMAPSLANLNSDNDQNILEEIDEEQAKKDRIVGIEKSNESNGFKVLPRCDSVDETMQLDSHSVLVDTANPEKDSHGNGRDRESENENTEANQLPSDTNDTEDRLSHFEEVVEKVVELHENGELEILNKPEPPSEDIKSKTVQRDKDANTDMEGQQDNAEAMNTEEAEPEEVSSPSQSQSSRATRWEALADIAAELPPSLAVDPLTGQIYALSK
ncbi:hypothetical protein O0L34_g18367 [Tuta absoluta]|nr:hypothetical protein O0L34_g18367 [Tuta absoluta]